MDLDVRVKLSIYCHFAETGRRPAPDDVARGADVETHAVLDAYTRLRTQRVLVLEPDGRSILMAPPFSGVETPHTVESDGVSYFANCAWDALGIPAAMHRDAIVRSACGQSGEGLRLAVGADGPERSDWLFHCAVPAAHWWDDVVFT
jgi:hypothetical protein